MTQQLPDIDRDALRSSVVIYDDFLATSRVKPRCILNFGPIFDLKAHEALVRDFVKKNDKDEFRVINLA